MMKKIISVLLVIFCLSGMLVFSANAAGSDAMLYHTYQNSMIFQHDKPITLAGTAGAGSRITFDIYDKYSKKVRSANGVAGSNGNFEITCNEGISPSYDAYTIRAYDDGVQFAVLSDVLFGVVWMAGGQSNMQFELGRCPTGAEMKSKGKLGSQYLRFLSVDSFTSYNGRTDLYPLDPQNDILECKWVKGNNSAIYDLSAVSYYFGEKLQKELNMPVAVIIDALAGTSIYTWLSRDAIEGNAAVRNDANRYGAYISSSNWAKSSIDLQLTMTANFNKKIYPMRFFKIDGMIWYQGESDTERDYGCYKRALELLHDSYSELFGFEDCLMPFVCAEIANYHYGDQVPDLASIVNVQIGELQQERPESVAQVTVYDIDLECAYGGLGAIHPSNKYEVGDKLSYAALGLVYNLHDTFTAPVMRSTRISGSNVYVSFDNVGDGLMARQVTKEYSPLIYGFSICGADGNYVSADATIIDESTVKVSNALVTHPEAVSYAYTEITEHCNLFSSENGKPLFGVTPFVTYYPSNTHFNDFKEWMECDFEKCFRSAGDYTSREFDVWEQNSIGSLSYDYEDKMRGAASLSAEFYINGYVLRPVLTYNDDVFGDEDNDYSGYEYMGFWIKNTSDVAVTLSSVDFFTSDSAYYSPTMLTSNTIPAHSDWTGIVLNLNKLKYKGSGVNLKNSFLKDVKNIEFRFDRASGYAPATIKLDYFFLVPETSGTENTYDQDYQVTYCGNRGVNVPDSEKTAVTRDYKITESIPTRKGFSFVEWNTRVDGSGTSYLPGSTYTGRKDLVLYAIWGNEDFNVRNLQYDAKNGIISGVDYDNLGIAILKSSILNDNLEIVSENGKYTTGTILKLKDSSGNVIKTAVLVVFGDVNQDGVCDGNDAVIAEMLKSGMLTSEQLGIASTKAADCDHDGVVTDDDIDLMFSAGLGNNRIVQIKSLEIQVQTDDTVTETTFFDILLKLFTALKNCLKLFAL